MKSGSSAFIGSHGHSSPASADSASYQWSRPSFIAISPPVCAMTSTALTSTRSSALSTLAFKGTTLPPRSTSSAHYPVAAAILEPAVDRLRREATEDDPVPRRSPRAGDRKRVGWGKGGTLRVNQG